MARVRIQPGADAAVAFESVGLWMPKSRRRTGGGRRHRLRRLAGEVQRTRTWVLRQASAHLDPGEIIAVVGTRNSGRESVLRLAAGTLLPDAGRVLRNQTVVPIVSLARCLDRRLTTRQNIYLVGGLVGMTPNQITAHLDSIIDSSGVRSILDKHLGATATPIRQRLAWHVAMATESRAFAIEQVVGAAATSVQDQAWAQIQDRAQDGAAFLIVSDDERRLRSSCTRAWYLDEGTLEEMDVTAALARLRLARGRDLGDAIVEEDRDDGTSTRDGDEW